MLYYYYLFALQTISVQSSAPLRADRCVDTPLVLQHSTAAATVHQPARSHLHSGALYALRCGVATVPPRLHRQRVLDPGPAAPPVQHAHVIVERRRAPRAPVRLQRVQQGVHEELAPEGSSAHSHRCVQVWPGVNTLVCICCLCV